jgi:hypothetical protein
MTRVAVAAVMMIELLAACGASSTPAAASAGSGSAAALYAKKLVISWGIEPHGSSFDVFLATTDETGEQESHALGTYPGVCSAITPPDAMKAVSAVGCTSEGTLVELDAVQSGDEVVVLKSSRPSSAAADPMARVELTRVKAPPGSKLELAPPH